MRKLDFVRMETSAPAPAPHSQRTSGCSQFLAADLATNLPSSLETLFESRPIRAPSMGTALPFGILTLSKARPRTSGWVLLCGNLNMPFQYCARGQSLVVAGSAGIQGGSESVSWLELFELSFFRVLNGMTVPASSRAMV